MYCIENVFILEFIGITKKMENIFCIASICIFIVLLYTKVWFNASFALNASNYNYMFSKDFIKYKYFDKTNR